MTEAVYWVDGQPRDLGDAPDLPGWAVSPPIRTPEDLTAWLAEHPKPNPAPDSDSVAEVVAIAAPERPNLLKRGLRAIGLGLLAIAEDMSNLSPEAMAEIRKAEERARIVELTREHDLHDLGIYETQTETA